MFVFIVAQLRIRVFDNVGFELAAMIPVMIPLGWWRRDHGWLLCAALVSSASHAELICPQAETRRCGTLALDLQIMARSKNSDGRLTHDKTPIGIGDGTQEHPVVS